MKNKKSVTLELVRMHVEGTIDDTNKNSSSMKTRPLKDEFCEYELSMYSTCVVFFFFFSLSSHKILASHLGALWNYIFD